VYPPKGKLSFPLKGAGPINICKNPLGIIVEGPELYLAEGFTLIVNHRGCDGWWDRFTSNGVFVITEWIFETLY